MTPMANPAFRSHLPFLTIRALKCPSAERPAPRGCQSQKYGQSPNNESRRKSRAPPKAIQRCNMPSNEVEKRCGFILRHCLIQGSDSRSRASWIQK